MLKYCITHSASSGDMGARIPFFDKSTTNLFILCSSSFVCLLSIHIPIITIKLSLRHFFHGWFFHVISAIIPYVTAVSKYSYFIFRNVHHISGNKDGRLVKF